MIPKAITRALTLPRLEANTFADTPWYSAEDKAKFGNHLLRLIAEQYPRHLFTRSFYRILSSHFGHIAHYAEYGFWDHYFVSEQTKAEFLADTLQWHACGDPTHTFSDLERAVQRRIKRSGVVDWQSRAAQRETEHIEHALLKKLQQKYAPQTVIQEAAPRADTADNTRTQADLFG